MQKTDRPRRVLRNAELWLNGATMKKTPSNRNYRSAADSQEPGAVKEKITFESALREGEIDEVFVARKLKDLLRAEGKRWNPRKESWEKFEDYDTQLAALREIAKISGIYGKDSEGTDVPVIIHLGELTPKEFREHADDEHQVGSGASD